MLGVQNQEPTIMDALQGQVQDWYEAVDSSLTSSDITPGTYVYEKAVSYGAVGDLRFGVSTQIDLSCSENYIISLENSYFTTKQKIKVKLPGDITTNEIKHYYIGYKSSMDCIERYTIKSNTASPEIASVNDPHFTWFMLYNSVSDEAKENSECYATLKKVHERNPAVPGVYVDLSDCTGNSVITVEIPLKIPVNGFLELYNLKYFPGWAGKLNFELTFSHRNLCIVPIIDES